MLEADVTLVEEGRAPETLRAGDAAGWRSGDTTCLSIENRSDKPAYLLEIGTRPPEETAVYVGLDLMYRARDARLRWAKGSPPMTMRTERTGSLLPEIAKALSLNAPGEHGVF